jgi:hypothetical protein
MLVSGAQTEVITCECVLLRSRVVRESIEQHSASIVSERHVSRVGREVHGGDIVKRRAAGGPVCEHCLRLHMHELERVFLAT